MQAAAWISRVHCLFLGISPYSGKIRIQLPNYFVVDIGVVRRALYIKDFTAQSSASTTKKLTTTTIYFKSGQSIGITHSKNLSTMNRRTKSNTYSNLKTAAILVAYSIVS